MLNNIKLADKLLYSLVVLFVLVFIWSAIAPHDRGDWMLENILVVAVIATLMTTYNRFRLSTMSYILIVSFLILHEFGAHYTYSLVPYNEASDFVFGFRFNELMGWDRNHFDRLVHFLFGVMWVYPIKEFYSKVIDVSNHWNWFFATQSIIASSVIFEFLEWGAVFVVAEDLGMHYLGTQGDIWDAHKDMLLASIGACLVWFFVFIRGKVSNG